MPLYPRAPLLPRLFFCLTVALALALGGLVLAAPSLDREEQPRRAWPRLVAVFARDAAVRRTAGAGAAGLLVTACIFFRPPSLRRRGPRPPRPSSNTIGA
jgi:hypothetical protein